MSQENLINMECTVCHNLNYQTKKSKGKSNPGAKKRLELSKFCKFCKKQQPHKETK